MTPNDSDLPRSAPVIDCAAYSGGRRVADLDIDQIRGTLMRDDQVVWLGLYEPDQALLRRVQQFGLHDLAIEDAIHAHQRPKLELYEDSLFVVLRTAHLTSAGHRLEFGETHVFVGRNYIATVRHGSLRSHIGVRQRCESTPHLLAKGPGYVLYALMDFIVDQYLSIVQQLDHVLRLNEAIDAQRELLTTALEAHLSLMTVAQNDHMKRITAWAAMIAVPTMIAGIYGMNFRHMPELQWEYCYYLSLAAMGLTCVGLYVGFRRYGWL